MSLENILAANAEAAAKVSGTGQNTLVDTAAAQTTTATAQSTATPTSTQAAPGITLTPEQWAAYSSTQNRIAELEAAEQRRAAEAHDAQVKALQAKGQIEAAFNLQREQSRLELEAERGRLKATEERAKRYALDGELARALAAQPLVPGGADQLTQLWRNQFSVEAQGDTFAVRTPDYQPVGSWIAAQLGRPEYAHFIRSNNQGGSGANTSAQSTQTQAAQAMADPGPRNMGDAIARQMQGIAKQTSENAHLSGGSTLGENGAITREKAAGFGLRPLHRA